MSRVGTRSGTALLDGVTIGVFFHDSYGIDYIRKPCTSTRRLYGGAKGQTQNYTLIPTGSRGVVVGRVTRKDFNISYLLMYFMLGNRKVWCKASDSAVTLDP